MNVCVRLLLRVRKPFVRVIHRVHGGTTDGRTDALPTDRTGLAVLAQLMLFIRHFADRGAAVDVDATHFTRAQTQLGVHAFTRHQHDGHTGRASDLRALARLHLDAMDGRTDGDVADGQGVTSLDRRLSAAHDGRTHFQATRSDDVTTLAVGIAHQSDVGRTVRVVLDALNLGGDAVLVALEVHHTVVVLVPTALG